ncbi:MAG: histidine phosphatase family protein [Chitinivorax sp.]|jgi:probable phosphoglycerate mutase
MITRFCFVRHGETDWNVQRRLQGHIDTPLNQTGQAQAEATAKGLNGHVFDAIYSSDLIRTLQTARYAAQLLDLPIHLRSDLRERHYGAFQGLTYSEAERNFPGDYARFKAREAAYEILDDGESLLQHRQRVQICLENIAAKHAGESVLIVTHGGVLDIIYRLATGLDMSAPRDFGIPNAALNWINFRQGEWQLLQWADQAHLHAALDELP